MSNRIAQFAFLILAAWSIATLATLVLPLDPAGMTLDRILAGPSTQAWLGYDDLGRPIVDRLLIGARTSLLVAIVVVTITGTMGTLVGIVSGWYGGAIDMLVMRCADVILAFPGLLLAIVLAGLLGAGLDNVIIALTVSGWVGFARLARAQTLSVKARDHVLAARALGTGPGRIMLRHVLPLIAAPLLIEASFAVATVIVAEAGLSFLGLGIQPPAPSLGSMIRDGTRYMLVAPHMVLAPGLLLLCLVVAINTLGDHARDTLALRDR